MKAKWVVLLLFVGLGLMFLSSGRVDSALAQSEVATVTPRPDIDEGGYCPRLFNGMFYNTCVGYLDTAIFGKYFAQIQDRGWFCLYKEEGKWTYISWFSQPWAEYGYHIRGIYYPRPASVTFTGIKYIRIRPGSSERPGTGDPLGPFCGRFKEAVVADNPDMLLSAFSDFMVALANDQGAAFYVAATLAPSASPTAQPTATATITVTPSPTPTPTPTVAPSATASSLVVQASSTPASAAAIVPEQPVPPATDLPGFMPWLLGLIGGASVLGILFMLVRPRPTGPGTLSHR